MSTNENKWEQSIKSYKIYVRSSEGCACEQAFFQLDFKQTKNTNKQGVISSNKTLLYFGFSSAYDLEYFPLGWCLRKLIKQSGYYCSWGWVTVSRPGSCAAARFLIILNLSYGRVCRLITLQLATAAAAGGCGSWPPGQPGPGRSLICKTDRILFWKLAIVLGQGGIFSDWPLIISHKLSRKLFTRIFKIHSKISSNMYDPH